MKKLRKLISAALVLAMLLTSASIGALAYSDVDESSSVSEAVGILSNLKIFTALRTEPSALMTLLQERRWLQ